MTARFRAADGQLRAMKWIIRTHGQRGDIIHGKRTCAGAFSNRRVNYYEVGVVWRVRGFARFSAPQWPLERRGRTERYGIAHFYFVDYRARRGGRPKPPLVVRSPLGVLSVLCLASLSLHTHARQRAAC